MHFDPVSSQEPPSARSSSIESAQIIDHEIESEDESPLRRAREGLPPLLRFISPLVGLGILGVALAFWRFGIRHYQSTGT